MGDAVSDLLVECILAGRGTVSSDMPNRLGKVAMRDRNLVTITGNFDEIILTF